MDLRIRAAPVPKPKIAPKTVVRSGLLQLAGAELELAIRSELAENPALEVTEAGRCEICGSVLTGSCCPQCRGEAERTSPRLFDEEDTYGGGTYGADDDWDPVSAVAAPWSVREHLLWQLSPQLSDSELEIASLLLENLDHRGLLDCETSSIAAAADVRVSQVEAVLSTIQRQDPVGIGSRTVEEGLLLQLDALDGDEDLVELSRQLIQDHWEPLCKGKLRKIARVLRVAEEDISRARDFIKASLNPYPIHACIQSHKYTRQPVDDAYLRPDVIITASGVDGEEEFGIQFPAEKRFRLSLDRGYETVSETIDQRAGSEDAEGYEHVRQCVERGRLFISAWRERWQTLHRVVERLIEHQREFLLKGENSLRPLTRAQLAEELGVHESTVSRSVASKYALLPGGRIVALADFFDGSLRAKSLIQEWISDETHPLTDGELVDLLAESGVSVARRTVAKYRQALGILPSELR